MARLRDESPLAFSGVLLDMRGNPGGLVDEAAEVADEFLVFPASSTRHDTEGGSSTRCGHARGERSWRRPWRCSSTSTARAPPSSSPARSRITGALLSWERRRSARGRFRPSSSCPRSAGLKLTTMRYYTPSAHSIQAQGIQPDILVESSRVAAEPGRVLREKISKVHLPAEEKAPARGGPVFRKPDQPKQAASDRAPDVETGPRTAADVPLNPVGGRDFALSIAYQVVRGVLAPPKMRGEKKRQEDGKVEKIFLLLSFHPSRLPVRLFRHVCT